MSNVRLHLAYREFVGNQLQPRLSRVEPQKFVAGPDHAAHRDAHALNWSACQNTQLHVSRAADVSRGTDVGNDWAGIDADSRQYLGRLIVMQRGR